MSGKIHGFLSGGKGFFLDIPFYRTRQDASFAITEAELRFGVARDQFLASVLFGFPPSDGFRQCSFISLASV
jgi:hypothetical protein